MIDGQVDVDTSSEGKPQIVITGKRGDRTVATMSHAAIGALVLDLAKHLTPDDRARLARRLMSLES